MTYPLEPAVLIVEDEILIRMLAVEAFVEAGFIVFEAGHAAEALEVLSKSVSIHLLFTDVHMPGEMDGIEMAEQLAAARPELCVIITSALPIIRPIGHLPATFVSKPYDLGAVCRTANELLAA